jgi:hypothetical protein
VPQAGAARSQHYSSMANLQGDDIPGGGGGRWISQLQIFFNVETPESDFFGEWKLQNLRVCLLLVQIQNISSSTHYIESLDAYMEH